MIKVVGKVILQDKKHQASKIEPIMTKAEEIQKKIEKLLNELNSGLYEKERSIRLTLLAVLAGESTFMLGEPGTAKSLVARRISEAFEEPTNKEEVKFFDYLMNQFSQPDEIFGPVSVQELKNDNYRRKTAKYLPKAQFAFLDEIWKANPAIQNALLTILNEKIFRNGGEIEHVPLIGFMSASNELPAKNQGLDAIFDRFLVRILELPISDEDDFRNMVSAERIPTSNITEKLSAADIETIQSEAEKVELSDDCFNVIQAVRKIISEKNNESNREADERYIISDRRWKKIVNLMRVSAYCNGRTETDLMDASLIADCIWSTISQEQEAKTIMQDAIGHFGLECTTDFEECEKKVSELTAEIDKSFFSQDKYTVPIQGEQYYVLYDFNGNENYISATKDRYSGLYYFLNSNGDEPGGINSSDVQIDLTSNKVIIEGKTYRIQPAPQKLATTVLTAASECFDKMVNDRKDSINRQISQIDQDMGALDKQFKSNLFANSDLYCNIVLAEQIKMKDEFDKLINIVNFQQSRYKKLSGE